jgi:hypothetical protein
LHQADQAWRELISRRKLGSLNYDGDYPDIAFQRGLNFYTHPVFLIVKAPSPGLVSYCKPPLANQCQ